MTSPLTPERLREIRGHFEAALDESPADLDAWLRIRIPDDADLRREVAALVAAHHSDTTLASPIERAVDGDLLLDQAGRSVGPWRIVRLIGAGGMGAVHEAVRSDGDYRMRVAIKLLRRGIESELAVSRFRYERQLLARLKHPNIAALLDGGMTEEGQPYFVMEYVEGEPITTWCESRNASVATRVRLLLQVIAAVQYAHQDLVVHRDLKPGNILVTPDGTVKLLDFGIARLQRDAEGIDQLPVTQGAVRAFTPDYASPEQVRGIPVGTASDVYSLGVVMFELLTGRRPFQLHGRLLAEVERTVLNDPPPLPSGAVLPGHGISRRELEGDLDAIILTALRKEPERRYGSMPQFAADLRAWLDGRPVAARPDGGFYRVGKLVRRHRLAFATGVLALGTLLAGALVTRRQAAIASDEQARAQEVTSFLTAMLAAPDPGELGHDVTMREVLDSAAVRADTLSNRPDLEIEIRRLLSGTWLSLGDYDKAIVEAERGLAAARRLASPDPREIPWALARLSTAHEYAGSYLTADSLLSEALALLEKNGRRGAAETADYLDHRGRLRGRLGDPVGAIDPLRRSLQLRQKNEAGNDSAIAYAHHNLAVSLGDAGMNDSADLHFRTALMLEERAFNGPHPMTAATYGGLGVVLERLGRLEEADTVLRRGVTMRGELLGTDHPDYAWAVANHADLLMNIGDARQAAERARIALAVRQQGLPDQHPAVAFAMQVLGRALAAMDSTSQGEYWLRESLRLRREHLPEGHWAIASSESVLGYHLAASGKGSEGERLMVAAEATLREARGADSRPTRDARQRLLDYYRSIGNADQAARWEEALGTDL